MGYIRGWVSFNLFRFVFILSTFSNLISMSMTISDSNINIPKSEITMLIERN